MNSIDRDISTTDEWRALEALAASTGETTLRRLFDRDPDRGSRTTVYRALQRGADKPPARRRQKSTTA